MPVHTESTSAMASSSTSSKRSTPDALTSASIVSLRASSSFSESRSLPASSKRWASTASFFCCWTRAISFSRSLKSGGTSMRLMRRRLPASSMRSIALSGRWRSEMYRSARLAAATRAWSVIVTRWWASYRSRRPFRISIVWATVGSSTTIFWNRRSRAASFSRCLRYSSSVVAPIVWSSPRASIGFRIDAASMAPSAAPAPTRVCSSSMNRMMSPRVRISLRTFFSRSSKSPR